jgi:hypothetical protein
MVNRRAFLRILALGVVGHELDIDRLLWVPGAKKIFIPKPGLTNSQIMAAEWARFAPKIATLFERDSTFYTLINKKELPTVSSRDMRIPLTIIPGGNNESD